MWEMAGNFLYLRKHLLDFETQDPNVEWYTSVETTVQNAIQCYHLICEEKKQATIQTLLDHFSTGQIELNPEPVPSTLGMREIAACRLSPVVDDSSALPPSASFLSSSQ